MSPGRIRSMQLTITYMSPSCTICTMSVPSAQLCKNFSTIWQPWSMTESTTLLSVAFSPPAVVTGFDDNSMGVRAIDASPAVTGEASIGVVRIVASTRGYCFEPWSGVLQTVQATYAAEMLCCLTESDYCFVCICFCLWAEFLSFLAYAAARALSFASSSGSTGVRAMGCLV